jgi:hypothetical protein
MSTAKLAKRTNIIASRQLKCKIAPAASFYLGKSLLLQPKSAPTNLTITKTINKINKGHIFYL